LAPALMFINLWKNASKIPFIKENK